MAEGRQLGKTVSAEEAGGLEATLVHMLSGGGAGLVGQFAAEIEALPGLLGGLGVEAHDPAVELGPVLFPGVILAAQLGVDPHALHVALEAAVREHLQELGELRPRVD